MIGLGVGRAVDSQLHSVGKRHDRRGSAGVDRLFQDAIKRNPTDRVYKDVYRKGYDPEALKESFRKTQDDDDLTKLGQWHVSAADSAHLLQTSSQKQESSSRIPPPPKAEPRRTSAWHFPYLVAGKMMKIKHAKDDFLRKERARMLELAQQNEISFEYTAASPTRTKRHSKRSNNKEPDMYHQGNLDMYSNEILLRRMHNKSNPLVRESFKTMWASVAHLRSDDGLLYELGYIKLMVGLHEALVPEFDSTFALQIAKKEWKQDSRGQGYMDFPMFFDAMFELTDIWCETAEPNEYSGFADSVAEIFEEIEPDSEASRSTDLVTRLLTDMRRTFLVSSAAKAFKKRLSAKEANKETTGVVCVECEVAEVDAEAEEVLRHVIATKMAAEPHEVEITKIVGDAPKSPKKRSNNSRQRNHRLQQAVVKKPKIPNFVASPAPAVTEVHFRVRRGIKPPKGPRKRKERQRKLKLRSGKDRLGSTMPISGSGGAGVVFMSSAGATTMPLVEHGSVNLRASQRDLRELRHSAAGRPGSPAERPSTAPGNLGMSMGQSASGNTGKSRGGKGQKLRTLRGSRNPAISPKPRSMLEKMKCRVAGSLRSAPRTKSELVRDYQATSQVLAQPGFQQPARSPLRKYNFPAGYGSKHRKASDQRASDMRPSTQHAQRNAQQRLLASILAGDKSRKPRSPQSRPETSPTPESSEPRSEDFLDLSRPAHEPANSSGSNLSAVAASAAQHTHMPADPASSGQGAAF